MDRRVNTHAYINTLVHEHPNSKQSTARWPARRPRTATADSATQSSKWLECGFAQRVQCAEECCL